MAKKKAEKKKAVYIKMGAEILYITEDLISKYTAQGGVVVDAPKTEAPVKTETSTGSTDSGSFTPIGDMTVKELEVLAASQGISLKDCTNKDSKIEAINKALAKG